MGTLNILLVVFVVAFGPWGAVGVDQTQQPGAVGAPVVEAVINLIRESCLFADDKRFLRRLAYAQSRDGSDPKTYRINYHGGIWQVDQAKFTETLSSSKLTNEYNIIQREFGIDWPHVQWSELRKPLYSGIAAALYTKLHGSIGWRVESQAQFYQQYFKPLAGNNFTQLANLLDLGCHGNEEMDLVFVVDSSNSLSSDDFERTKYFMQQVVDAFNISNDKTQVGIITYSTAANINFYLNQYNSQSSLKTAIGSLPFKSGSTNTAQAITKAVNDVYSTYRGGRPRAVKVMIVVTDGESDDTISTRHAAELARANGIVMFSVGVGSKVNQQELSTIATTPDCTHVFTVTDYTEIKAIKEEIQKSSCQAPVFIKYNVTYTCEIQKCPPMALVTTPGGATLETNMTCGLGNVYTAFTNPYPGESFYEVVKQTSNENPGVLFRNSSSTQTLYINVVDALKSTTTSNGCIVHITPKKGDQTNHNVRCYIDGVEIKCPDDCKEKWNFPNPCTAANLKNGKTRFPHPTDTTKYLECDQTGKLYIVQCPQYMSYYQNCLQCLGNDTMASCVSGKVPLNQSLANPCTLSQLLAGHFFFKYAPDETKFIHCDVWGKPWLLNCPPGEVWDHPDLTCVRQTGYKSPCRGLGSTGPFFYPHPCDKHKYIQCDDHGQEFIITCSTAHFVYNPNIQRCESRLQYTPPDPTPGTICPDGSVYSGSPVVPTSSYIYSQYVTGSGVGYACCSNCPLFTSPCTNANIRAGKLLYPLAGDRHHYIQCDLTGRMFCPMSCNPNTNGLDYFDPITSTCVDGSLFIDNIVG